MKHINTATQGRRRSRLPLRLATLGLALPLGACSVDKLLQVQDPDVASPTTVQDSSALPVVYAGAIADFALAYGGSGANNGGSSNEGQILLSGLLGDEFRSTDTFDTRIEIDQRAIVGGGPKSTSTNAQLSDAERNLHRARRSAEVGTDLFAKNKAATSRQRAELFGLAGYSYVFFGENYCSGVAFSSFPVGGGTPTYGAPTSRDAIFQLAIARFDSALAIAPAGSSERYLAQVGRGRALLNLNDRAGAAAAVAGVPTSFNYNVLYSQNTTLQNNGVFAYTIDSGRYDAADNEGGNGLPYVSDADPRTPTSPNIQGPFNDNFTEFNAQLKYPTRDAAIPLASGTEARLIEAENQLNAGASTAYLTTVNALRAGAGLANLTDPGSAAGRVNQLFKERAYWLWLTSHRLGDMRRLIRQYGRTQATVYPVGEYPLGGEYGTDVNLPIYVDEANNPNFTGCTDRNA